MKKLPRISLYKLTCEFQVLCTSRTQATEFAEGLGEDVDSRTGGRVKFLTCRASRYEPQKGGQHAKQARTTKS